jgi:ribonuclease HII
MPNLEHEQALMAAGYAAVCGVDEAGRGPWAGPVVAAAVLFRDLIVPDGLADLLDDSKSLSPLRRARALAALHDAEKAAGARISVAFAGVDEIDATNILAATLRAMARAVAGFDPPPGAALVDGNRAPDIAGVRVQTLVKGDGLSLSIAAASIVAKETRDAWMAAAAQSYPGYGFERHMGYGTAEHRAALETLGPCPIHRRSFAPVRYI